MKPNFFHLFMSLLLSAPAFADEALVRGHNVSCSIAGCASDYPPRYVPSWQRGIQKANIVGHMGLDGKILKIDPRGGITTKGPEIGLTPAEIEQARKTTGHIFCPGGQASAALVGDGSQIITNAHVFMDEEGRKRDPLSACYFQNQESSRPKKLPLIFKEGSFLFMTDNPYKVGPLDLAFVKVKKGSISAKPFPIDPSGVSVYEGQSLIVISASQLRMTKEVDPNEPIVQSCTVQKVVGKTAEHASVFLSDCSSAPQASGSITLVRNSEGQLRVKGILRGGGMPDKDYEPFSIAGKSYTIHLGLDGIALEKLLQFEKQ